MSEPSPAAGSGSPPARYELLALTLLSLATVATAWCSFQAAAWSGLSQRTMSLSAAAGRRAAAMELQSYQLQLVDIGLFSHYINARASSNGTLAQFYSERFRGEAKSAFDAWMTTRPFENPEAPPHPFVTNLYQPRMRKDAGQAEAESARLWQESGAAGRISRSYVLLTVVLASALFCGGIAAKFETLWIRRTVLGLGVVAFLLTVARMASLPMQL